MPKAEKKEKPEKKEKKVKDPNAPKRPLAAYMFFCKEKREETKKEDETLKFGAIGKLLGERWKVVEEGEKAVCVPCARTSSLLFEQWGLLRACVVYRGSRMWEQAPGLLRVDHTRPMRSFARPQTVVLASYALPLYSETPLDLCPERTPRAPGDETGFVRSYCTGLTPWRSPRGGRRRGARNIRLRKVERLCPPNARVVFTDTYRMVIMPIRGRRTPGASPPARRGPLSVDRQKSAPVAPLCRSTSRWLPRTRRGTRRSRRRAYPPFARTILPRTRTTV